SSSATRLKPGSLILSATLQPRLCSERLIPARERGSPLCHDDVRNTNGDQEKRKELAARERPDQFSIGLAEIFDHDSKDRVTNEKQSGQHPVRLARARPHKPQNRKQHDPFEESLIKLRWMPRR